jgi:putative ABC transport system substrate-binding protein
MNLNTPRAVDLALNQRLPLMTEFSWGVEAGAVASYGPSLPEAYRRAVRQVDRILKGANPAEIPIEQPTQFEMVINLKTARALSLTVPSFVLARADRVIQ